MESPNLAETQFWIALETKHVADPFLVAKKVLSPKLMIFKHSKLSDLGQVIMRIAVKEIWKLPLVKFPLGLKVSTIANYPILATFARISQDLPPAVSNAQQKMITC